jgi:hypothetical protein
MEVSNESSSSLLNFVLTLFLRITQHYNISNNAVTKILAFFSFALGMLVAIICISSCLSGGKYGS